MSTTSSRFQQMNAPVSPAAPGMSPMLSSFVVCPVAPPISIAPLLTPMDLYQLAYAQAEIDVRRWHWHRAHEPGRN
jgi:hypothetical protein